MKLVFSPAAEADLVGIALYIAADDPERALSFVEELGRSSRNWKRLARFWSITRTPASPDRRLAKRCARNPIDDMSSITGRAKTSSVSNASCTVRVIRTPSLPETTLETAERFVAAYGEAEPVVAIDHDQGSKGGSFPAR